MRGREGEDVDLGEKRGLVLDPAGEGHEIGKAEGGGLCFESGVKVAGAGEEGAEGAALGFQNSKGGEEDVEALFRHETAHRADDGRRAGRGGRRERFWATDHVEKLGDAVPRLTGGD